jgi:hypothetical protein
MPLFHSLLSRFVAKKAGLAVRGRRSMMLK